MIDLLYIPVEKSVRFPAWNQSIDDVVNLVLWYWVSYLLIWIHHKSSHALWYKCSWFWLRSGHGIGGNQRKPTDQVNAEHVTWHVGYPPFRLPLVQPSSPNCRWFPRYFLPWGTAIHRRESTIANHPSTNHAPCAASSASNPFGSLTFPAVYSSDKDGNFFATNGVGFCFLNLAAFVNGMMMWWSCQVDSAMKHKITSNQCSACITVFIGSPAFGGPNGTNLSTSTKQTTVSWFAACSWPKPRHQKSHKMCCALWGWMVFPVFAKKPPFYSMTLKESYHMFNKPRSVSNIIIQHLESSFLKWAIVSQLARFG